LSITNLSNKLIQLPYIIIKFQKKIFLLRKKIKDTSLEIDKIYQKKYLYYKNDFNFTLKDSEIKNFIERDVDILEKRKDLDKVEVAYENLMDIIKSLDNVRWTIKSIIDNEKFKAGII